MKTIDGTTIKPPMMPTNVANSGLGASGSGISGDASLLLSLGAKASADQTPLSAALVGQGGSLYDLATQFVSAIGSDRLVAENSYVFHSGQLEELRALEMADGVDSDREMQNLLLIEQGYAANARVIETIDELMETLLRL